MADSPLENGDNLVSKEAEEASPIKAKEKPNENFHKRRVQTTYKQGSRALRPWTMKNVEQTLGGRRGSLKKPPNNAAEGKEERKRNAEEEIKDSPSKLRRSQVESQAYASPNKMKVRRSPKGFKLQQKLESEIISNLKLCHAELKMCELYTTKMVEATQQNSDSQKTLGSQQHIKTPATKTQDRTQSTQVSTRRVWEEAQDVPTAGFQELTTTDSTEEQNVEEPGTQPEELEEEERREEEPGAATAEANYLEASLEETGGEASNLGMSIFRPMEWEKSLTIVHPWERTMCKLYEMCDAAGNSRKFGDSMISAIRREIKYNNFDILNGSITTRQNTIKNLNKRIKIPPPKGVKVELESGRIVTCYSFDIMHQLKEFLLLDIWSDLDNLAVPKDNPWSHYGDPTQSGEMLNGNWAKENALEFIRQYGSGVDEEDKHIQVPIIMYIDKTGTDKIEKNSLEPIMATTPLLKNSTREDHSNWFFIGFVPNLTEGSSAGRGLRQGEAKHRSTPSRDYHACLKVLLKDFAKAQKETPVLEHRRGNWIQKRKTHLPIACIIGDNLAQNALDARVGNFSSTSTRLSRRCLTEYTNASTIPHTCYKVDSHIVHKLSMGAMSCTYGGLKDNLSAQDPSTVIGNPPSPNLVLWKDHVDLDPRPAGYKKKLQRLLRLRSLVCDKVLQKVLQYHAVDNALHDLDFGKRTNGYIDALVSDILHSIQSGTIPRVTGAAMGVMTKSQKYELDCLVSTLFFGKLNKSSHKTFYPRTNFNNGFSSLTNLTAEGKTGQLFTLAIIMQTWRGRKVMSKRFDRQFDTKRSNVQRRLFGGAGSDDDQESVASDDVGSDDDQESVASDDTNDKQSSEESQDEPLEEPKEGPTKTNNQNTLSDEQITFQIVKMQLGYILEELHPNLPTFHKEVLWDVLRSTITARACSNMDDIHLPQDICDYKSIPPSVNSPGEERCPTSNESMKKILKLRDCSRAELSMKLNMNEFSVMIEGLLAFTAYVKHGHGVPGDCLVKGELELESLNLIMVLLTQGLERGAETNGWNLQKTIEMSHFFQDVYKYGSASGFSSNTGERGLKIWAKLKAITAQRRADEVFTKQVTERITESQLLFKVAALEKKHKVEGKTPAKGPQTRLGGSNFILEVGRGSTQFWVGKKSGTPKPLEIGYGPSIESWFKKRFSRNLKQGESKLVELYTEVTIDRGEGIACFRCHPNFSGIGPWFDFCMIMYGEPGSSEYQTFPGRIACIFREARQGEQERTRVLVQEVEYQTDAEKRKESPLFHHYTMQHTLLRMGMGCHSKLVEMDIDNIACAAYAVESGCALATPFEKMCKEDYQIILVKPFVEEWPSEFLSLPHFHRTHQHGYAG